MLQPVLRSSSRFCVGRAVGSVYGEVNMSVVNAGANRVSCSVDCAPSGSREQPRQAMLFGTVPASLKGVALVTWGTEVQWNTVRQALSVLARVELSILTAILPISGRGNQKPRNHRFCLLNRGFWSEKAQFCEYPPLV